MSRPVLLLRQSVCLLLLSCLAFPAEIPVRNIILYKHGIAYFERAATIASGEEARLDFKTGDMNDVLKSLTVTDRHRRARQRHSLRFERHTHAATAGFSIPDCARRKAECFPGWLTRRAP